mgnify:FL=1
MYQIGEKIVYPMHGAGVVQAIEEKEVMGEKQSYYVLKIPTTEMKLMVPVEKAESIGVRPVISPSDIEKLFNKVKGEDEEESGNWNKRYRENLSKIKTGNIVEVAKVVKSLAHREMDKPLSTCEKKMLTNARHILVSELVLATDDKEEVVEKEIDALIAL